jgi:hypothetical protein
MNAGEAWPPSRRRCATRLAARPGAAASSSAAWLPKRGRPGWARRSRTLSTAAEATSKLPHNSSAEELTKFLRDHSEGIGCAKFARRQSVGSTCIAHGGGPRCDVPDCGKSAQGATGASGSQRCIAHGGGPRCDVPDCSKSAATCLAAARARGRGWDTRARRARVRRACARADERALAPAEHQWTGRHLESLNLVR